MRYLIEQHPETQSYYIKDLKTGNKTSLSKYKCALEIIDDKYVIVGRMRCGLEYGLITIDGDVVVDTKYDAIYVNKDRIFYSDDGLMNEMTFLNQFVWHNKVGEYYSNTPYLSSGLNRAEINVSNGKEAISIDCYGHLIEEANHLYDDYDYDEFGNRYKLKWGRLWNLRKDGGITLPCGLAFTEVSVEIIYDTYFAIYKSGYNSDGKWVNTYYCLVDINGKVLHSDLSGFSVNHFKFNDRLVIDDSFILDELGNKYPIPDGYEIAFNSDKNGFIEIYKDGKRGYMNNRGEIVVPTIFEKKEPYHYIDEDYYDSLRQSTEDAFEGDSSARWNVD